MNFPKAICFALLVTWTASIGAQSADRDVIRKAYPLCFELFPDEVTIEHKACLELSARYPTVFASDKGYVEKTVRQTVDERNRAAQAEERIRAQREEASSPTYKGLEFKGIALGSEISLVEDTGRYACHDPGNPLADRICSPKFNQPPETIAGVALRNLLLLYYSGRLETITITFDASDFSQVAAALAEKYGQAKVLSETLKNRMGATFENRILLWYRGKATVEATRYHGSIDRSSVIYRSERAAEEFARRQKTTIKSNRKDL